MNDNEKLLKRLQDSKSSYNVYGWETDRKEMEHRVKNISKYNQCQFGQTKSVRRRTKDISCLNDSKLSDPNNVLFQLYKESIDATNAETELRPDHPFQKQLEANASDLVLPEIQQHINSQNKTYGDFVQNHAAFQTVKPHSKAP